MYPLAVLGKTNSHALFPSVHPVVHLHLLSLMLFIDFHSSLEKQSHILVAVVGALFAVVDVLVTPVGTITASAVKEKRLFTCFYSTNLII